jgi:hypothetical protein
MAGSVFKKSYGGLTLSSKQKITGQLQKDMIYINETIEYFRYAGAFAAEARENREPGANPGRPGHCEWKAADHKSHWGRSAGQEN